MSAGPYAGEAFVAPRAVPPRPSPYAIRRPRLEARLDDGLARRLTTVVAGPGTGKTTLLTTWLDDSGVWYAADAADQDPFTLARGLVAALRLRVPGLGATIGRAPAGRPPYVSSYVDSEATTQGEALAEGIGVGLAEGLEGDLALVVDNVHELVGSEQSQRLLEALCRHAPPGLHLVLSSHDELGLATHRLRVEGQLTELTAPDLAFTVDEVAALLERVAGDGDRGLAARLHALTSGWAMALRLGVEALGATASDRRGDALEQLEKQRDRTFQAVVGEVLVGAPGEVAALVRTVAPLERFTAPLASALGVADADAVLAAAERRGTLVAPDPGRDGWFTVPPVVRTVVTDRASSAEVAATRNAAAGWLAGHGHPVDALRTYAAAPPVDDPDVGDSAAAAALLEAHGSEALAAGEGALLLTLLGRLPRPGRSDRLVLLESEARQARGDGDGALRCLRALVPAAGPVPVGVAWRAGLALHMRGEIDAAVVLYERGLGDTGAGRDRALLRAWFAAATFLTGDRDRCAELAREALTEADDAGDSSAAATAHTALAMAAALAGDRRANDTHYLRALEHAERVGDVFQVARIQCNRASQHLEEGSYSQALAELEVALRSAEQGGFTTFRALALLNRGQALCGLGRLDEAARDFELARTEYQRTGSRMVAYPLAFLGDVHREQGDLALARAAYEEAIEIADPPGDLQGLVPALSGLARTLADVDPDLATQLADRAVGVAAGLHHQHAVLARGWVALVQGDLSGAAERAGEAARVARGRRDRSTVAEALLLGALARPDEQRFADLEEAGEIWRRLDNPLGVAKSDLALAQLDATDAAERAVAAEAGLRRAGARRLAALASRVASARTAAPRLVVRTLGGFQVLRDGVPVSNADWGSKKPRDLLKVLVARRGGRVTRDALIELLWPDEDPAKATARLSVALSTLRSVLDPGKVYDSEHPVQSDRSSVWVQPGVMTVDVMEFLDAANQGLAARRGHDRSAAWAALTRAEASYAGDFLEEDAYEDWSAQLRDDARNVYVTVAHALARLAADEGDHDAVSRYLFRVLRHDPHDERAHLALVEALDRSGRRGDARRAYRTYAARMRELGVDPQVFPA